MSNFQFNLTILPHVVLACLFVLWIFSKYKMAVAMVAVVFFLAWGGVLYYYRDGLDATYTPLIMVACFLALWFLLRHKRVAAISAAIFCVAWCAAIYSSFLMPWLILLAVCAVALWPVVLQNKPGCVAVAIVLCLAAVAAWLVGEWRWIPRVAAWLTPLLVCGIMWPTLRRSRAWVVAAAVTCMTPFVVPNPFPGSAFEFWPLALAPPGYLVASVVRWNFEIWAMMGMMLTLVLPVALPIGVAAWLLCEKYLPPPTKPPSTLPPCASPAPRSTP